ncbi:MAG: hypothetical protein AB7U75_21655 [Hyphomicrobiaceae bacterium]
MGNRLADTLRLRECRHDENPDDCGHDDLQWQPADDDSTFPGGLARGFGNPREKRNLN